MGKPDEYRKFASVCLELARTAARATDKTRLLTMAEAWLDLADRAVRQPQRQAGPAGEHPLIRQAFGSRHLDTH